VRDGRSAGAKGEVRSAIDQRAAFCMHTQAAALRPMKGSAAGVPAADNTGAKLRQSPQKS